MKIVITLGKSYHNTKDLQLFDKINDLAQIIPAIENDQDILLSNKLLSVVLWYINNITLNQGQVIEFFIDKELLRDEDWINIKKSLNDKELTTLSKHAEVYGEYGQNIVHDETIQAEAVTALQSDNDEVSSLEQLKGDDFKLKKGHIWE